MCFRVTNYKLNEKPKRGELLKRDSRKDEKTKRRGTGDGDKEKNSKEKKR